MARRAWESLSPSYRARLERGGITPESYSQGVPLKGARGHAATPERPERAFRHPDLYPQYLRRRVARGDRIPPDMLRPMVPRRISDGVGWPGRDSVDVWMFTRSPGGSAAGETGTMTHIQRHPDGTASVVSSGAYDQGEFVDLAREARQRGFIVQVISVPSMGVTA